MLCHLSISNYTIVSRLEIEFGPGMTVITGETGAGKSIMLDALGLCLGDRAEPRAVRQGCERAEVIATFDLAEAPAAQAWLDSRDLSSEGECLLRRVVTVEGRSRAYINGSACTLQDCSELGGLLIDIHGQHAHQSLLRRAVQRDMLDAFAGHRSQTESLAGTAADWLRIKRELALLTGSHDEHTARSQLLEYQVEELKVLDLQEGELQELEAEEKLLANAEEILASAQQAIELCEAQEIGTRRALQLIGGPAQAGREIDNARELLDSAAIALNEACGEIRRHVDGVEINPERLGEVRQRLEDIYDIARKHRIMPEQVLETRQRLEEELSSLAGSADRIEELQATLRSRAQSYREQAGKVSAKRARAARKLSAAAEEILATLAMNHCQLHIQLTPRASEDPHPHGAEEVELLVSTVPGAPPQPLGKIASGGELSRIGLAIQVVAASSATVSSMIFDEVDAGISGGVAEVVGNLLRRLSSRAQILCVTHLPQVAAQAHQHLCVSKQVFDKNVETALELLDLEGKVEEVARMLGGVQITAQTRAHAREMLEGNDP